MPDSCSVKRATVLTHEVAHVQDIIRRPPILPHPHYHTPLLFKAAFVRMCLCVCVHVCVCVSVWWIWDLCFVDQKNLLSWEIERVSERVCVCMRERERLRESERETPENARNADMHFWDANTSSQRASFLKRNRKKMRRKEGSERVQFIYKCAKERKGARVWERPFGEVDLGLSHTPHPI